MIAVRIMRVLVDYDNLPDVLKGTDVIRLADRIFEAIRSFLQSGDGIQIRLYGGWFAEDKLTKKAQLLSASLASAFPYPLWIRGSPTPTLIPVTAALAYSLEKLPRRPLYYTYRERPPARRMHCEDPESQGCASSACPLVPVAQFVRSGRCSEPNCGVTTKHLLRAYGGQKLVDTMMVADLAHLARVDATVAIVSSDDDVWPGILMAMLEGAHVVHIQTGRSSGVQYSEGVPGKYSNLSL